MGIFELSISREGWPRGKDGNDRRSFAFARLLEAQACG
jgi:hypothetical protein